MLIKNLYQTKASEFISPNEWSYTLVINRDHEIYKGHFPGLPVTPGYCQMQIVKEITEVITKKNLLLVSSSNIKFVHILNPENHPLVTVQIIQKPAESDLINVSAKIFSDDVVFSKCKCLYKIK